MSRKYLPQSLQLDFWTECVQSIVIAMKFKGQGSQYKIVKIAGFCSCESVEQFGFVHFTDL